MKDCITSASFSLLTCPHPIPSGTDAQVVLRWSKSLLSVVHVLQWARGLYIRTLEVIQRVFLPARSTWGEVTCFISCYVHFKWKNSNSFILQLCRVLRRAQRLESEHSGKEVASRAEQQHQLHTLLVNPSFPWPQVSLATLAKSLENKTMPWGTFYPLV